jgi:uncharacterized caspase-like protein
MSRPRCGRPASRRSTSGPISRSRISALCCAFRAKASGAQVALVDHAGHGIEANCRNWLIPVDAQLNSELDLPDEANDPDR